VWVREPVLLNTEGAEIAEVDREMVAWILPIVNRFVHLLSAYSNVERRIRMRGAEVERFERVGGIETIL
jgi:hypothetical protein